MYNKKKNKWAPNVIYKKMFQWAKNTGFRCEDARDKVSDYLSKITESRTVSDDDVTIEYLVKKFIKTGLTGFTLRDESRFYKPRVAERYKKLLSSYVLFEGCTDFVKKKHTAPVEYQNTIYSKPFKSYKASELTKDAIEAFKFKMKDTPQVANSVIALLSVVYNWSKQNQLFKGDNPFLLVKRYSKVRVKAKLPDDKRDQIKDYCESKAFDYNPHFLTLIAMVLYTGFRGEEMFGLRWQPPKTDDEKKNCSGWLEPGWDNEDEKSYIFLWDPKNRKEFKSFIRKPLKRLLIRLRKKLYNDQKVSWCLKSDYIFPKTRWKENYPKEHTDAHAQTYPLRKLNEDFGLRVEKNGKLKNFFTLKIGRKTFGSWVAAEKGTEFASRSLNHKDTQVTRDHYIVPEDSELDFEFEEKQESNVVELKKIK
ncbi:MAG TPA: hypothetical protein DHV30_14305 [Balneola sp.]|nr:hypothetical protein [Balneola sp.]